MSEESKKSENENSKLINGRQKMKERRRNRNIFLYLTNSERRLHHFYFYIHVKKFLNYKKLSRLTCT